MKNVLRFSGLIIFIILFHSCEDKPAPPAVATTAITAITETTAVSGGNITDDKGSPITGRGVCWGTVTTPTTANNKTSDAKGTGSFVSSLSGLLPGTTYYVRSYATNIIGTSYGNEISFKTLATPPTLTTTAASLVTLSGATLNGTVNANNLSTTVSFEYGTTTSYGQTTAATPATVTGTTVTSVSGAITGLTANTLYHFRVKAVNSGGTTYGSDMTFTTSQISTAPVVTTTSATSIVQTGATLNGTVNANNLSTTVSFEYGTTTSYGQTTAATPATVTGTTVTSVSGAITGLTANTLYHFRVKAVNSGGTTYGSDMTFTTSQISTAPVVTTTSATSIVQTGATLNGTVNANNLSTTVSFEYGTTTSYGQTTAATPATVTGTTVTSVSGAITGLTANTLYHFRVKAVNSGGTTYGSDLTFTTTTGTGAGGIIFNPNLTYGSVSDIDGNTYKTIQIGTQTWMAENLKTTKYNDGTNIPNVTDNAAWTSMSSPAYCWYKNDAATYKSVYGALYNWYVGASTNTKKVCPTGWHVPADNEWTILTSYLGGESVAGEKLKESGFTHWQGIVSATNASGFTALPGGDRNFYGSYYNLHVYGNFWSSTAKPNSNNIGWQMMLIFDVSPSNLTSDAMAWGFSVRCLKDN